jgi:O-antigen ligase
MLCGGILCFSYGPRAAEAFLESFVIVGSLIGAFGIGALLLVNLGVSTWLPFADAQLRGLVANPNAFGLLAVLALTAIWLVPLRYAKPIRGALAALWSIAAYLSFSRATWIACAVVAAGLFSLRRLRWRPAVLWMAAPVAAVAALIALGVVGPIVSSKFEGVVKGGETNGVPDPGITGRVRLAKAALELWRSAPILGAGLGVHWQREQAANPDHPLLLHSTPLWLLAETGIVGFCVFGAFAMYALRLWLRARRSAARDECLIEEVAIVFVCAFAVMSLFHDILYQRILWIVLGFALAAPHAARPPSDRVPAAARRGGGETDELSAKARA